VNQNRILPRPRWFLWSNDRALVSLLILTWILTSSDSWIATSQAADRVEWSQGQGFRWHPAPLPPGPPTNGFTRIQGAQSGIRFTNTLAESRYITNQVLLNGSGVSAGDVDGDGWCDLYFASLDGPNGLYRNLGNWRFENITAASGLAADGLDVTACALVDVDGDGDLDALLNTVSQGTHLFLNSGKGQFTPFIPPSGPLNPARAGMSMALADIDGDGDLDLYVANYRSVTIRDQPDIKIQGDFVNGKPVVVRVNGRPATDPDLVGRLTLEMNGKIREHGEPDVLFLNQGGGKFTAESFTSGRFENASGQPLTTPLYDWGLSAMFRDINGDGLPDLYVCNDFESEDRVWVNLGNGRFRETPGGLRHTSMFSMGVDFADVNRDGLDDFFVADMMSRTHARRHLLLGDVPMASMAVGLFEDRPQYSHNTLFLNRGGAWRYTEMAFHAGIHASEWSWAPVFLDVDLDGYEDLLITAGHQLEMMNADIIEQAEELKKQRKMSSTELLRLRLLFPRLALPHVAFRNRGDLTFEDSAALWGFDDKAVSHGMALADLDNDGDLDIAINNLNSEAGIYRNNATGGRVAVMLKGQRPNSHGIGAVVRLLGGATPVQHQEIQAAGRYLSSDQPMRVFATGTTNRPMTLEVAWRSGRRSTVSDVVANRVYEIEEPAVDNASSSPTTVPNPTPALNPLFVDESRRLTHQHFEEPYDDFARQPLLPHKLSQLGPGVCWTDFDGDGWDDLVIASGKGGSLAAFKNDRTGGFSRLQEAPFTRVAGRDQTTVVGFGQFLFVGLSNHEDGLTNGGYLGIYDLARKASGESVLGPTSSTGPVAMGDIDGDGDLDFFIGGRAVAGRYPEPATSLLLRNDNGRLVIAERFEKLGLVSGAIFSDVNGDGFPELVLALEWGSPRVFSNQHGKLADQSTALGLASLTGLWNSVAAGDFDGDGRMDLILGNHGLNSRAAPYPHATRRIRFGDFNEDGTVQIVETTLETPTGREVPDRSWRTTQKAMPFLNGPFQSHAAYGASTVEQLYGDRLKAPNAGMLEAREFASMILLDRGNRFEAKPLPMEAQLSAVFGIAVADFDGDGHEDVFLSQNQFALNAESTRLDGGYGLVLRGNGQGSFHAMSPEQSGVAILGEQRGCAVADYDGDGRPDLVVAQNGAPTVLLRNASGRAGVRVRFRGPQLNGSGIGVRLWTESNGRKSPAREIHAGSGYWSQDSAIQVLPTPSESTTLHYVLPGGKSGRANLPATAKEIEVGFDGEVKVVR